MSILELYYGLKSGKITLGDDGLCKALWDHINCDTSFDFKEVMCAAITYGSIRSWNRQRISLFLPQIGLFTPERETFLLIYAAYKGEL